MADIQTMRIIRVVVHDISVVSSEDQLDEGANQVLHNQFPRLCAIPNYAEDTNVASSPPVVAVTHIGEGQVQVPQSQRDSNVDRRYFEELEQA